MGCCNHRFKVGPDIHHKTIAFVGPQKSGKTSIIYYLKNKQSKKQYEETKQIQQEIFEFKGKVYDLKDLPTYNDQVKVDAWVYVIDNNNLQEIQELNDFLKKQVGEKPVLLLKNKCDLSTESQQIDDKQIQ